MSGEPRRNKDLTSLLSIAIGGQVIKSVHTNYSPLEKRVTLGQNVHVHTENYLMWSALFKGRRYLQ